MAFEFLGWFLFSCVCMSFIEHQVHSRLMHRKNFLSDRSAVFKKIFESHSIVHHGHYATSYTDEPVARGSDREIRLNPLRGVFKALPFACVFAIVSWKGAVIFVGTVVWHHLVWNQIHLEMHKPEGRFFSRWRLYKYLARYHYLHHCHPNKNFNVVFPLADFILGTHVSTVSEKEIAEMRMLRLFPTKLFDSSHDLPRAAALKTDVCD